jgi:hypothetical protein
MNRTISTAFGSFRIGRLFEGVDRAGVERNQQRLLHPAELDGLFRCHVHRIIKSSMARVNGCDSIRFLSFESVSRMAEFRVQLPGT